MKINFEVSLEEVFEDGGFIGEQEFSQDEMEFDKEQYEELKRKLKEFKFGRRIIGICTPQEMRLLKDVANELDT